MDVTKAKQYNLPKTKAGQKKTDIRAIPSRTLMVKKLMRLFRSLRIRKIYSTGNIKLSSNKNQDDGGIEGINVKFFRRL